MITKIRLRCKKKKAPMRENQLCRSELLAARNSRTELAIGDESLLHV